MRIKLRITFLIVAFEAEIRCFAIGHPPERNLIESSLLALQIEIVAGKTCELAVFQGKISGDLCLLFIRRLYVRLMYLAIRGLQVAPAQKIVITFEF